MRILHAIKSANPEGGGPIEAIRQAGRAMEQLGHETEIVCLDAPDSPWLAEVELPVHALGPTATPYLYSRRFTPWLRKNAPAFDATVVHNLWLYLSYGIWKTYRRLGLPYFVYTHGSLDPQVRRIFPIKHLRKQAVWLASEHRMLRDATSVLYTCEIEKQLAKKTFWPHLASKDETILPYCVASPPSETERQLRAFSEAYPELVGKRLLLFLSRVHPKKGCDLALEAFAKIKELDRDVHLVMAGPTTTTESYHRKLRHLAESLGIADRVTWTGMLQGDLKWGAFRSAELFVLPSHQENFGIAVVEALACELPVLISDRINIWSEINECEAGLICTDRSDVTADRLREWLAMNDEQRSRMRENARACFEQRFSIDYTSRLLESTLTGADSMQSVAS